MKDIGRRRCAALLAAVMAFAATGCAGTQWVRFERPAQATFLLDGEELGAAPVRAELSRESLHRLTVRSVSADGFGVSVSGNLLVLGTAKGDIVFTLEPARLAAASASGRVLYYGVESGEGDLLLWFKGSAAGVPADDAETEALLPSTLGQPLALLAVGTVTLVVYAIGTFGALYLMVR